MSMTVELISNDDFGDKAIAEAILEGETGEFIGIEEFLKSLK